MKFSHQIQFNAVPDWAEYYLPYSNLKKLIYIIEKDQIASQQHGQGDLEYGPSERTALIDSTFEVDSSEAIEKVNRRFIDALNKALDKIVKFYAKKETELYDEMDHLLFDYEHLDQQPPSPTTLTSRHEGMTGSHSEEFPRRESLVDVESYTLPPAILSQNTSDMDFEHDNENRPPEEDTRYRRLSDNNKGTGKSWHGMELKKRTVDLFVLLSELKSFVALNMTAFSKILKKYDKITNNNLKRYYLSTYVNQAYPFQSAAKSRLNERIQETERGYAFLVTEDNNLDLAIDELKTHLREHIVWERNTVWRDMVGQERKTQSVGISEIKPTVLRTPWGRYIIDRDQLIHIFFLVASLIVFAGLLSADIFGHVEQNRCFAILVFASMLWAGEVMPLFVTALLVPLLIVTLRVMRSDDGQYTRLDAPAATKRVFAAMFSPVIMLLLGGFAIAGALSKFGIAKSLATFVLSKAGTRPNRVLLVNMLVATVASMWISNVAAPVLCFSLIQPILRTLPVDSRFAPCLIIGIALASNLGGMASPISSPQNIIAIQNMSPAPSWGEWFIVSIPLCLVGNGIIWLWLLWNYTPEKQITHIHPIRASSSTEIISWTQMYVGLVTLVTIIMWCLAHSYEDIFGDMGVIAIIPVIAFFGTGLLTKDDFNNFLWNVIMLAMGGIALGKAVESSGLLHTIAQHIEQAVTGFSAFQVLAVFSFLVLIIATFISHTVAALIVLPIVAEVGTRLDHPEPRMLVMGTAFVCSCAMGLPVSGFPNMNAIAQENELGKSYLSTKDFLRNGVPGSIYATVCVTTLGYILMKIIGF
ncbi:SPX domain-containing protein [Halteromyces radiatus]|uniref:SPX domain-containing protein n=1 Tax=Halteromyces radiatus TaxID=101107 RepID=UPI00222064A9|nr:SPX domain-containing protein [Halteromyces radiatus]KAI8093012.1 SPX domain-containing protein [Halteromyces radiatus]